MCQRVLAPYKTKRQFAPLEYSRCSQMIPYEVCTQRQGETRPPPNSYNWK